MNLEKKVQKEEEKSGFLKKCSYSFVVLVGLLVVMSPKTVYAEWYGPTFFTEKEAPIEPSNLEEILRYMEIDREGKLGMVDALKRYMLNEDGMENEIFRLKRNQRIPFCDQEKLKKEIEEEIEKSEQLKKNLWVEFLIKNTFQGLDKKTERYAFNKFKKALKDFRINFNGYEILLKRSDLELKHVSCRLKQSIRQKQIEINKKMQENLRNFLKEFFLIYKYFNIFR